MTDLTGSARADRVAARATGVGIGFLTLMIVWLVGARATERIWGPPSSAVIALVVSVIAGMLATVIASRRLLRRQLLEMSQATGPGVRPVRQP